MHVLVYQLTLDFTRVSMNFLSTIVYMQSVYLSYSGKIGAELGKLFIDNWTNVLLEFINLKKSTIKFPRIPTTGCQEKNKKIFI